MCDEKVATEPVTDAERLIRVLFVCVENSCRSQAYSAGVRPSGRVHAKVVACMAERGIDLGRHHSKGLRDVPDLEYDAVVTMGCGAVPEVRARRREDWDFPAPRDLPPEQVREIRDRIERQVKELLKNLEES